MQTLENQYYKDQTYISKRELLEIFPEAREYLQEDRERCKIFFEGMKIVIKYQLKMIEKIKNDFNRWFWEEVLEQLDGNKLEKYGKRIREIDYMLSPKDKGEKQITEEEVERAKEYPFEELIKPVKVYGREHFMATCPFHSEKTPSFYVKNKFAYCFGCGKSVDTIAFVMETEGLSFIEAVHKLT
jgi:hypothetical protein